MPNVNDMQSIVNEYPSAIHLNGNGYVIIHEQADEDGDFGMMIVENPPEHTDHTTFLSLPIQGSYEDMIDWIRSAAKTGEL